MKLIDALRRAPYGRLLRQGALITSVMASALLSALIGAAAYAARIGNDDDMQTLLAIAGAGLVTLLLALTLHAVAMAVLTERRTTKERP